LIAFLIDSLSLILYTEDEAVYDAWIALQCLVEVEEESHILMEILNLIEEVAIIEKIVDLIFTKEDTCHPLLSVLGNLLCYSHEIIEEQVYNSRFFR
jgi:hypothetical protein